MEFARESDLPLTLQKKNGEEYSQSDFESFDSFLSFVKNNFSTADIAANTFEVNSKDKQIGDLALMKIQTRTSDEFGNEVVLDGGTMHCVGYQSVSPIRSFWGTHINGQPQEVRIGGNWFENNRVGDYNRSHAIFITRIPNFNTVLRWNYLK